MQNAIHLLFFAWAQFLALFGLYQLCNAIERGAPASVVTFAGLLAAMGAVACIGLVFTMPSKPRH